MEARKASAIWGNLALIRAAKTTQKHLSNQQLLLNTDQHWVLSQQLQQTRLVALSHLKIFQGTRLSRVLSKHLIKATNPQVSSKLLWKARKRTSSWMGFLNNSVLFSRRLQNNKNSLNLPRKAIPNWVSLSVGNDIHKSNFWLPFCWIMASLLIEKCIQIINLSMTFIHCYKFIRR